MIPAWPLTRLDSLLQRSHNTIEPAADIEYKEITVRMWGKGVVERGRIVGSGLSGRRYIARTGQFIISRIDARHGAMGLVPPSLKDSLVTNDFPLFNLNTNLLEPSFFAWLCRTANFVQLCRQASEGTTNRVRLKEERFLSLEIPLPPLTEQRRVVVRIEELASQIYEAQTLRNEAVGETEALLRSIFAHDEQAKPTPMRDLVKLRSPNVIVVAQESYQFAGVYSFGRGVFKASVKSGMDFAYSRLTRLRAGEFVYPKLMAWEGALGIVPPDCDGCVVSTEFPVFEVLSDCVLPEVLDIYFRTPSVWPELSGASTGTNVRRRRLNPQDFLNYKIPLPSWGTQLKIRDVKAQVEVLKRLRTEIDNELQAMLPAILDKAFKGEL